MKKISFLLLSVLTLTLLAGCGTTGTSSSTGGATPVGAGAGMKPTQDPTRVVPAGNQFIGQRYYTEKFMYWGFVRPPQDNWGKTTRLVMLREEVPAPDRPPNGPRGRDDGTLYKLNGYFSGQIAYEPKSDLMLDVFVLQGYEVISENNKPIDANTPFWVSDRMYYRNSARGPSRQGTKAGLRLHEDFSAR